jgi:hypothetical protein
MKKKTVSLCASKNAGASSYLEYRFGTRENIELRYRGLPGTQAAFSRAEILGASNASTVVWFTNAFSCTGRPISGSEQERQTACSDAVQARMGRNGG